MKTIALAPPFPGIEDILRLAHDETVLVKTPGGESFVISAVSEFDSEVELLRRNHEFLSTLDDLKKEPAEFSLEEMRRDLV
jgi:hypothetical protein